MVHFFSRSRAANPAPTPSSQPTQPTRPFPYKPLDTTGDGIRLLILEPAKGIQDPVRCRLRHTAFGNRPEYEALSYMWGDSPARKRITIDGSPFDVTPNLLDALRYLRHENNERVLWVDAICINQADDREKSSQIRIMAYIYMRAQVVLVWLGFFTSLLTRRSDLRPIKDWQVFTRPDRRYVSGHEIFLRMMCDEPYWNRVWIIQEVTAARKVQICYAKHTVEWKYFINAVNAASAVPRSNLENTGPMRLQKQIEKKYTREHKLQNLLEIHRYALCKEPRDHVYGLVGLATDCVEGFPIDYRKSLFEVWKDTVMLKNVDRSVSQHDIMKFGRLVQEVLGGSAIATADEISRDLTSRMAHPRWAGQGSIFQRTDNVRHNIPSELQIPGRLVGRIDSFGPTFHQIFFEVAKTAEWKGSINKHIPQVCLARAREESDLFIELLEEVGDEHLRMITSFHGDISWKQSIPIRRTLETAGKGPSPRRRQAGSESDLHTNSYILRSPSTAQHLFLLELWGNGPDSPGRIGLAPPEARIGDLVLQIHGIERAVLVRNDNGLLRLVGTVVLAENRDRARAARRESAKRHLKFGAANFAPGGPGTINLSLDVAIAYQLLLG